jgi:hypothetical protein
MGARNLLSADVLTRKSKLESERLKMLMETLIWVLCLIEKAVIRNPGFFVVTFPSLTLTSRSSRPSPHPRHSSPSAHTRSLSKTSPSSAHSQLFPYSTTRSRGRRGRARRWVERKGRCSTEEGLSWRKLGGWVFDVLGRRLGRAEAAEGCRSWYRSTAARLLDRPRGYRL